MRTTIDIPDKLFRRMKATASYRGLSMKSFIALAVEHELGQDEYIPAVGKRVQLPLIKSRRPASLDISAEMIAEVMEEEDEYGVT